MGASAVAHGPYNTNDMDAVLMVTEPYADVYIKWLFAQIDFHNAEYTRYNNSMIMYNAALSAYADAYNRSHMPTQTSFVL
ncbi:hypothetical protein SDC9_152100 [bioreactor metagenome]|uniref:Uncharacterized protein n=1 Tax=bioreactor metagenome TaxID=1076179 RepID=A0A645EUF5_9ZZZZ